jgi:two-component system invasion response regulator UvrY
VISLLLVDDHPVVRAGYQRLLEQMGEMAVVAQAGDVDQAYAQFVQHRPAVTITDISMPGSSGLELLRRVLERDASARVLVFSMHDSEAVVRRALGLGARGFVTKSCDPDTLIDAVKQVHLGQRFLSADLPVALLNSPALSPVVDPQFESLTPREYEIFRLLAAGKSLPDCARSLHLSPKTVSNHQTLIKEKLGLGSSAAMALLAIRHGVISADGV